MALNMVDNTNYGFVDEIVGTFTPSEVMIGGLTVKQIGNVVYVSGAIQKNEGVFYGQDELGTITDVPAPAGGFVNMIAMAENLNQPQTDDLKYALCKISTSGNILYYHVYDMANADTLIINGYYFV